MIPRGAGLELGVLAKQHQTKALQEASAISQLVARVRSTVPMYIWAMKGCTPEQVSLPLLRLSFARLVERAREVEDTSSNDVRLSWALHDLD